MQLARELPSINAFLSKCTREVVSTTLTSNPSVCAICRMAFTADHVALRLPCGHCFGEECILAWFSSGAQNSNTCPMDRRLLFRPTPHASATFTRLTERPIPLRLLQSTDDITNTDQNHQTITSSPTLTRAGLRGCIGDLGRRVFELARNLEDMDMEPVSVDNARLRRTVEEVLPDGITLGERGMALLVSLARQLLVRREEIQDTWSSVLRSLPMETLDRLYDEIMEMTGSMQLR